MEPRAVRNNNPLNLKASETSTTLPGVTGVDPLPAADGGQFLQFDSPDSGFEAAKSVLARVYSDRDLDSALRRWSNNGYGGQVAKDAGLDPTQTYGSLTPEQQRALVGAMAKREGYQAPPSYSFDLDVDGKTYSLSSDHKITPDEAVDLANKIRAQNVAPAVDAADQQAATDAGQPSTPPAEPADESLLGIAKRSFVDPIVGAVNTLSDSLTPGAVMDAAQARPGETGTDHAIRAGKFGLRTAAAAGALAGTAAFPGVTLAADAAQTGLEYGSSKLGFSPDVAQKIGEVGGFVTGLAGGVRSGLKSLPEDATVADLAAGTTAKAAGADVLQDVVPAAQREIRQGASAAYQHVSEQATAKGAALDVGTAGGDPTVAENLLGHIDNLREELGPTLNGNAKKIVDIVEQKLTSGESIPYADLENLKTQLDSILPGRKPPGATPKTAALYNFKWDVRDAMRSTLGEGTPEQQLFDEANALWRNKVVPNEKLVNKLATADPLTAFRRTFGTGKNPQQAEKVFGLIDEASIPPVQREAAKNVLRRGFFNDMIERTGGDKAKMLSMWDNMHSDFRDLFSSSAAESVFNNIRDELARTAPKAKGVADFAKGGIRIMVGAGVLASGHPLVAGVVYGPEVLAGLLATKRGATLLSLALTTPQGAGATAAQVAQHLHSYIDTNVISTRGHEDDDAQP